MRSRAQQTDLAQVRRRAHLTLASVLGFVVGLVLGAILEVNFDLWSLAFPVVLAALAIPLGEYWPTLSQRASDSEHDQKQSISREIERNAL
jgi:uncharacterized membrane protein YoaK (UPF0700 family)